jgi:ketol-acid reductoisomerase
VLGYGNQGRAQALNLRDSGRRHGFTVITGTRPGGESRRRAAAEGFAPYTPSEAAHRASIVISLVPDEVQPGLLREEVFPTGSGKLLCLAHGFALVFGGVQPPESWDVVLVAPTGPGARLREAFRGGGGIPGLVAVHQDASGEAMELALSLAQALGLLRVGVLSTTVWEESVVDLFGEQAVLCGGLLALAQAAFDTLVSRGFPEDLAYLECIRQVGLTSELLSRYGPAGFRARISPTALFGELTRGPRIVDDQVRRVLSDILDEITSGQFAREWLEDVAQGRARLRALLEKARQHPACQVHDRIPYEADPLGTDGEVPPPGAGEPSG